MRVEENRNVEVTTRALKCVVCTLLYLAWNIAGRGADRADRAPCDSESVLILDRKKEFTRGHELCAH